MYAAGPRVVGADAAPRARRAQAFPGAGDPPGPGPPAARRAVAGCGRRRPDGVPPSAAPGAAPLTVAGEGAIWGWGDVAMGSGGWKRGRAGPKAAPMALRWGCPPGAKGRPGSFGGERPGRPRGLSGAAAPAGSRPGLRPDARSALVRPGGAGASARGFEERVGPRCRSFLLVQLGVPLPPALAGSAPMRDECNTIAIRHQEVTDRNCPETAKPDVTAANSRQRRDDGRRARGGERREGAGKEGHARQDSQRRTRPGVALAVTDRRCGRPGCEWGAKDRRSAAARSSATAPAVRATTAAPRAADGRGHGGSANRRA